MLSEIQNHDLYEKCKIFVKKSTELLSPQLSTQAYSSDLAAIVEISRLESQFKKLSEYDDLKQCMNADAKINSQLNVLVGGRHGKTRIEFERIISYIVRESCNHFILKKEFDVTHFDKLYSEIEGFFYNDTIPMVKKIAMKNCSGNSIIKLTDNIVIRPINHTEKKFFQNNASFGFLGHTEFDFSHVIEQTTYEKKLIGEQQAEPAKKGENSWDLIEKVVIALRLFKPGEFSATFRLETSALEGPFGGGMMYSIGQTGGNRPRSNSYLLEDSEGEFTTFWNKFIASKYHQSKSIDIAIRRFNLAYDRTNLEDKIIDYLISYEALFFKNEKQELNEKLSRRVSRLLKTDFDERKLLSREVKEIYQKRSNIVHGDETSLTEPFVQRVEEILRNSIQEFLERLDIRNHDEIIDHLDFD